MRTRARTAARAPTATCAQAARARAAHPAIAPTTGRCTDDACTEDVGCTHVPSATCAECDADECTVCHEICTTETSSCSDGCWLAFWGCLNGCTSTYCAPFCQVDLGRCLDSCPAEAECFTGCDAGNGCELDCTQP